MGHANIYIRRDNEAKWHAIPDKSHWINTLLDNSDDTSGYGLDHDTPTGPITTVLSQDLPVIKKKDDLMSVPLVSSPCKHGADPRFCRYAKPGKPCK